jgi:hypothetical protein
MLMGLAPKIEKRHLFLALLFEFENGWCGWLMAEVAGCQPLDQPSRLQPNRTGWVSFSLYSFI